MLLNYFTEAKTAARRLLASLSLLIVTLLVPFHASAADFQIGESYYTTYNLWAEKGTSKTTNYTRGELIPINSSAILRSFTDKKIEMEIDGRSITVVNVKKQTLRDVATIMDELLSTQQTAISGEFRDDILSGNMRLGMNKDQVIMTRGYPPRHKTYSTKSSTWIYWSSRFVQRTVVFQDGKLARGRGLY